MNDDDLINALRHVGHAHEPPKDWQAQVIATVLKRPPWWRRLWQWIRGGW